MDQRQNQSIWAHEMKSTKTNLNSILFVSVTTTSHKSTKTLCDENAKNPQNPNCAMLFVFYEYYTFRNTTNMYYILWLTQ